MQDEQHRSSLRSCLLQVSPMLSAGFLVAFSISGHARGERPTARLPAHVPDEYGETQDLGADGERRAIRDEIGRQQAEDPPESGGTGSSTDPHGAARAGAGQTKSRGRAELGPTLEPDLKLRLTGLVSTLVGPSEHGRCALQLKHD